MQRAKILPTPRGPAERFQSQSQSQSQPKPQPQHEGEEEEEEEEEQEGGVVALTKKLWMGNETEGWKERRLREEREALEEGRGYAGLIWDQIWEVCNWGKGKENGGEGGEGEEGEKGDADGEGGKGV